MPKVENSSTIIFQLSAVTGNNHLGGQDFNMKLLQYLLKHIKTHHSYYPTTAEDLQHLRQAVETAKLHLTYFPSAEIKQTLYLNGQPIQYSHTITRDVFEDVNMELFKKVLIPIQTVLKESELHPEEVDEIVLVGGSTRIPKIRSIIRDFFGKDLNTAVDPELAVASGVAIQAGILGGMWPLTVSALELPTRATKIHVS